MSKRKRYYEAYLKSAHWRRLRDEAFFRDNYRCCRCGSGSKTLQGHHRRYRKDLEKCTVKDIETLCVACHEKTHREKSAIRKERRKFRKSINRLVYLIGAFGSNENLSRFGH